MGLTGELFHQNGFHSVKSAQFLSLMNILCRGALRSSVSVHSLFLLAVWFYKVLWILWINSELLVMSSLQEAPDAPVVWFL